MTPDDYEQYEYECRPFDVACSYCPATDNGSQRDLEVSGWRLTKTAEICPVCDLIFATGVSVGRAQKLVEEVGRILPPGVKAAEIQCPF